MTKQNEFSNSLPNILTFFDDFSNKHLLFLIKEKKFLFLDNTKSENYHFDSTKYSLIYLPMNNRFLLEDKEDLIIELKSKIDQLYSNTNLADITFEEYTDFKGNTQEKNLLLHMINETKRIDKAIKAIALNDFNLFAKVINQANYSIKTLVYQLNQHQEQIIIFSHASNALATKLIDSGFIFLVETKKAKEFNDEFKRMYYDFFRKNISL
ncbi:MAG: hypothetical protein ACQERX_04375, partial [Bacillota bacterium]